ncbi:MAG: dihydrodipicolinate synthase family protein [Acidobacteriales bacterium]|nr:dihydrodipicolinate synthase family protein [Terriglobales bacterium]
MVSRQDSKSWAKENVPGLWGVHWVPFDGDNKIDRDGLRKHARAVGSIPMQGLSVAGMLNELPYVSLAERREIGEIVFDELRETMPLYFSVTTDSLPDTVELLNFAHDIGFDVAMAWPPPEHAKNDRLIYDYFKYLDENTPMAISAYSTPHSGRLMSPELAGRIAELESVCVIKYVTWSFATYVAAHAAVGDNAFLSNPFEEHWLVSNHYFENRTLYSTTAVNLYASTNGKTPLADYTEQARLGNWPEAYKLSIEMEPLRALWRDLYQVYEKEHMHPYAETKYWAYVVGLLDSPEVRAPQRQVSQANKQKIWSALDEAGLAVSPEPFGS